MRYQIYRSWFMFRIRLIGDNGEKVIPPEGYTRKENAQKAIDLIKSSSGAKVEDLT